MSGSRLRVVAMAAFAALVTLVPAAGASGQSGSSSPVLSGCIAHHVNYIEDRLEIHYTPGCTGHDEPELDPLSNLPGSARNLTWRVVLPSDGSRQVAATGPTFWFGGTVNDPDSLFGQAFLEVQFYPDTMVKACTPNGGFHYTYAPGVYTVCSPVWSIVGNSEPAAFNGMLSTAGSDKAMVMHAGDTVTIHYFGTKAMDGAHITVSDVNTGEQGTIILNSPTSGPLNPTFNRQKIGNALGWGIVHDAPNSFVWEIGHESLFNAHPDRFCAPGNTKCDSYDKAAWAGTTPIHILGVSFGDNGPAKRWAVVSDYGGKAQVTDPHETGSTCTRYGGPFCIYPWFTRNGDGSLTYGVDYPTTAADYGRAAQFQQTTACGGPFGARTTYCMTRIG